MSAHSCRIRRGTADSPPGGVRVTAPWWHLGPRGRDGWLAECDDVEITGTAQHEAWQARALPPVEQLRADLWSIPVPIPHNPLRYVSVYAFALDGGGLGLLDTGWESQAGWAALTDGLAAIGGGGAALRGVLVPPLRFGPLGLAARVPAASGRGGARHPA